MEEFKTIFRHLKESIKSLIVNFMSIIFAPVDAKQIIYFDVDFADKKTKLIIA
jgi:hypothetical protein